jgi:hypothetical protein
LIYSGCVLTERERRIEAERRVAILRANMVKVKLEDMGSILECSFFIQYNPPW